FPSPLDSDALFSSLQHRVEAGTEPMSGPSLSPEVSTIRGHSEQALSRGRYKCLELSKKNHPENQTGIFCAHMWDGLLCWDETPAGTAITQNCQDHTDLNATEKVTRYCNERGNWVQTGSTCQAALEDKLENIEDAGVRTKMIILEKKKTCLEKMKSDPPHNKSGLHCGRSWDGWLCWDDTPAGAYAFQKCPDYYSDLKATEKAAKYCGEDGQWFRHPKSNMTWTNYTLCVGNNDRLRVKFCIIYAKTVHQKDDRPCRFQKRKKRIYIKLCLCCNLTPGCEALPFSRDVLDQFHPQQALALTQTCWDCNWVRNDTVSLERSGTVVAQFSRDPEVEPTNEPTASPEDNQKEKELVRKRILDNQYKCFEKMHRDPPYNKSGPFCSRNWDGWLCWEDTPAGTFAAQNCPNYFDDFDPTEKATKYCGEDGQWFRHPDTNRTWSNYTLCNENTKAKLKSAYILFYMAIVGHALSIASLLISLAIFFYFRSLSCQRITLHKNLFFSYVLNSALTIIYLVTVVNNPEVVARNPVGCKVLHFFHMYMLGCNYFWMLCEGIYLHTLIVVAVFAEEQHLHWYYLLGWGFPLVPVSIHAVARKKYFDDNCWMSVETHLLYAVHGPIVAALLVNLFFLLNIIRVLVTKLRDTHRAESNMYMKAVRATLILVPLLGIQFVIFPWRPENRLAGEVYEYVMHILMHYQGLLVATIFCFFNGEVQGALKRQWMQYKTQWGQRRKDHCSMRSTSYTATSITEVPGFMYHHDSNTEHLNGRHTEDSELVALKSGDTYA
uniref:Calcitonin gene-related peptide type 1 receptor n=1 Tax=Oryzias latipes TaxID=8090 RepID=A0A3P9I0B8_ORYLA